MTTERGELRQVDWRGLCPWLVIFRTFRLATSMPVLFLSTIGALLTPVGWRVAEFAFIDAEGGAASREMQSVLSVNRLWPGERRAVPPPNNGREPSTVREIVFSATDLVQPIYHRLIAPVRAMFSGRLTLLEWAYFGIGFLWTLAVWSFFGGAITRIAGVKLGREVQIGIGESIRFAVRRFWSYVASPLFPLLGVALTVLPLVLLGLLARLDVGVLIAGIFWIFALLGGLIIALFLLGLLFGWPLMWGAISCEETGDAFEAFSRSYSYTFQRPLHYLFYALVATTFGAFCWLLVYHFSEAVIGFTDWAVALGAGDDRWRGIEMLRAGAPTDDDLLRGGAWMLALWNGLVRTIATAFGYSFFWCVAIAIYLLLRRDVDQTEFDEVYLENEDERYQLPPLPPDATGVPGVEPAAGPATGSDSPSPDPPTDAGVAEITTLDTGPSQPTNDDSPLASGGPSDEPRSDDEPDTKKDAD